MTDTYPVRSIHDAIRLLDPDGGWDPQQITWDYFTIRALRDAEEAGYTEHGVSFDVSHWRLTDDGIIERRRLDTP